MEQIVTLNKRGMSLVEVMIALVVMLLVFFALMQTALVGIDSNMLNSLRSEAVNVAEMRMNQAMNEPFAGIVSDASSPLGDYDSSCSSGCNDCPAGFSTGKCRCRDVKSIPEFKFCSNLRCGELGGDNNCATNDADNRQITVMVGWKWKGNDYRHTITTIRKR
jgi:prepilin-type N-terminal cleavage/methylation domain-containing protein